MPLQQVYAVRQGVSGPKSEELDTFATKEALIGWLTSKIMLEVRGREEQSLTFPVTIVKWLCNTEEEENITSSKPPVIHTLPSDKPAELTASDFEQAIEDFDGSNSSE
tara:strand:- start:1063 stop:1386 length:324 start_codon:yes stop_codon:yes gene_type:complete